jgi:PHD/YefM family antitoxin component YafN of YafNO toxin-antitoxin module
MTSDDEYVIMEHPKREEAKYMDAREYEEIKEAVKILFRLLTHEEQEEFVRIIEESRNRSKT